MAQDDIQGQVVDGAGNPVSGAIVELTKSYQSSPLDEQVVRRTTTDANGNYIFEFHPDGDGTTQEWHVSAYNHDGTAYVNSFNNPGVTADLPSNAIPNSVETQYSFGDQSDPTSDAVGSNDGDLVNSRTFNTSDPRCGSVAYDNADTGSGTGYVISESTTDLVANGPETAASVGGFIKASSVSDFTYSHAWGADSNNYLHVRVRNGNWEANMKVNGSGTDVNSGISVSTSAYQHAIAAVDQNTLYILVDGVLENSVSHSADITNIGAGNLYAGQFIGGGNYVVGLYDNPTYANGRLTDLDASELINQC